MPVRRLLMASPRPVPPYLRAGGRIGLAEGLEQAPHPVGRDADAGIAHGELQCDSARFFSVPDVIIRVECHGST